MTYQNLRALLTKRFHIPTEPAVRKAVRHFTLAERTVFYFFTIIFIFSGVLLVWKVSNAFLIEVPLRGGTLTEGVVGNPRSINPVLALSEADKNLVSLIYSGLVRVNKNGELVNDLAESVVISLDGLTYTVKLRKDATFHDGVFVTTDDVIFTVQKIQNPNVKSPLFSVRSGVEATKVDEHTINFGLRKAYTPFINTLTLGILPKHIWNNVTDEEFLFSQWNALPVGSGRCQIETVTRNSGGIPDYYELRPFDPALTGAPYVERFVFKFYPSTAELIEAYQNGDAQSLSGMSPKEAQELSAEGARVLSSPLPRIFGVFFNQNKSKVLLDKDVRVALDLSAPKEEIVSEILLGFGTPIDGPLPPNLFGWSGARSTTTDSNTRLAAAQARLEQAGWKKNEGGAFQKKSGSATLSLSFSISTSNTEELKAVASLLKAAWENLGAHVDVLVFEPGDLRERVIRPREFEALLFGEVIGRDADVYPFWHSSERSDPGLNIASYVNSRADKFLENLRTTVDPKKREAEFRSFDAEIRADVPAVFLYTPSFLYVVPKELSGVNLGPLSTPQDRFLGLSDWYLETNQVWQIFVN